MSNERLILDALGEAIELCCRAFSEKADTDKEFTNKYLQLAKCRKEFKKLRKEKDDTKRHLQLLKCRKELKRLRKEEDEAADSGWRLIQPNYAADCSFCSHNEGCTCVSPKGPYKTDATTCLAFKDKRMMKCL